MSEAAQRTKETLLHFGGFTLNLARRGLYRGSERVHLTSKPLETLILLVENRTRVVEKQTILDTVWNGTFVTDDVLVQSVREIRRVLGDDKENPSFIQTVPRQGYRFVGVVTTDLTVPSESIPDNGNTLSVASVPTANQIRQGWSSRLFAREHRHVLWLLVLVFIGGLAWLLSRSNLSSSIGTRFTSATPVSPHAPKNKTKTLLTTG
jgi:DNA-binding winged helix-turn-helix (wHTH) protein